MSRPSAAEKIKNTDESFSFPEVRVVEASAGSGKTYALAQRYIQLLLNPSLDAGAVSIRHILAITFTNKAAVGMKARILAFLKKIALQRLPPEELETIIRPLGIDPSYAQARAFAVLHDIIHGYNFFQVQTIDKFVNTLLSGCAFKIGLTANFKIKTDHKEYLEHSLDQLIDTAAREARVAEVFKQFLHNYLYLENRLGWFPKDDILSIVASLFSQHNIYGCRFAAGPHRAEDIVKKRKMILEQLRDLQGLLPEGTDARFTKGFKAFLEQSRQSFDIDAISDYFAREEIPVRKGVDIPTPARRLWANIRENLRELCEQEAYSLFNPYVLIFDLVQRDFWELSAKDDVLFLDELNRKAGWLFDGDHVTVAELYYRLASRFRHYLIDEFQDTNRLQWHNLKPMVEEALSTGGSLFYVGDRKQAIYNFRGGEAGLFDDIKDGFHSFGVRTRFLTKNWRSQKAIVDFNNAVFSPENLERLIQRKRAYDMEKKRDLSVEFTEEDTARLKDLFQGAQQSIDEQKDGGYVRVEYLDIDKKEERDEALREKVLDLIRELEPRYRYQDIAVLTRSNAQAEQMTNWLLEAGVPVESERTSDITRNSLVQELVSFLRFLNSPIDNVAFADFILGDIFSKISGEDKEKLHHFVFSLRERLRSEKDFYIYMQFREEFAGLWQRFMEEFFKNVGLYPLYELVVSVYHRFGLLDHFPEYQGFFMHFLELVKKKEEEHSDISSFLEYFEDIQGEDLYVHVTEHDAVKVLTIHKAKGLEFPVVLVPHLTMDAQVGHNAEGYQYSYILRPEEDGLHLMRLKGKYYNFSEELYGLYAQEYKKSFFFELNNIYVALTRAEEELYVFVPKRAGTGFNFAQFLIPEGMLEWGRKAQRQKQAEHDTSVMRLPISGYHDWIDYLKDEFQDADNLKNRDQRLKGDVIHYALSKVGNLDQVDTKACLDAALKQTAVQYPHLKDFSSYKRQMERMIEEDDLRPFFAVPDGEVWTEKEVVDSRGHARRLDRVIFKENEVWVVDFKSSKLGREESRRQMQEYILITRGMYPEKKVKGYLIYLDGVEIEEVN